MNIPQVILTCKIIFLIMLTVMVTFLSVRYYDHCHALSDYNNMKKEYTELKSQENDILLAQKQIMEDKLMEIKSKYEGAIQNEDDKEINY